MAERHSNTRSIRVYVIKPSGRDGFALRYQDPCSRKWRQKTAQTTSRREAERAAARLEEDLASGRYAAGPRIAWDKFRERYGDEVCDGLAKNTDAVIGTVFNWIEKILAPERLVELTADRLSYFQSELRRKGRSSATIRTYLAHLKSSLRWAASVGMLHAVPEITMPVRAKHSKLMKGRPITREETERMLESVPSIVGAKAAPSWRELIEGLWNSGLRISEALTLSWDTYAGFSVDMDGRYPMFLIRADSEKGNQDRLLAMAPEFARQLREVPKDRRPGRVFRLVGMKRDSVTDPDWASKVICKIGRAAGVVVNKAPKVKFASAHDLRRSFGERAAAKDVDLTEPRGLRLRVHRFLIWLSFWLSVRAASTVGDSNEIQERSHLREKSLVKLKVRLLGNFRKGSPVRVRRIVRRAGVRWMPKPMIVKHFVK